MKNCLNIILFFSMVFLLAACNEEIEPEIKTDFQLLQEKIKRSEYYTKVINIEAREDVCNGRELRKEYIDEIFSNGYFFQVIMYEEIQEIYCRK